MALMYSFPNFEPVCSSISDSNCCFLTCTKVSQEAGKVVWYSHLFKNFPFVIYIVKGFSVVNEAEVDVYLEFSWLFYDPMKVKVAQSCPTLWDCMDCSSVHEIFQARILEWVAISFSRGSFRPRDRTWVTCIAGRVFTIWATREALWSNGCWQFDLFLLPFLNPACTYGSSWFMYYWSLAWRTLSITLLACEMSTLCSRLNILWQYTLLWDWNENWAFPVLWPLMSFPNLLAYCVQHFKQHHILGFEIAQLEFYHLY